MTFADRLKEATPKVKTPEGWVPILDIGPTGGTIVTEATPNVENDPVEPSVSDQARILKDHDLDPAQWKITNFRKGGWGPENKKMTAWKLTVAPLVAFNEYVAPAMPDLHDLEKSIAELNRPIPTKGTENISVVGVLADAQIGKTGSRGGIEELIARLELSTRRFEQYLKKVKPSEVIVADAGDIIEGFENTAAQARTNDLDMTQQIRVARRVFWKFIEVAAANAPKVTVIGVSSNHTRVRAGKNYLSNPSDDWGLEIISQLSDMAEQNPALYSHVSFVTPTEYSESLAIKLLGGKILGLVHGHQVGKAEGLPQWWAGQSLGRTPVGGADILVVGHWHNLRIQTVGNDRWIFIAPTSDNGSDWFSNISGHDSATGVLAFTVNANGWYGLEQC